MSYLSEVYKHSGRWSPVGLLMPLDVLGVLSIPFGFIYAYAMMWCPLIYINLLGTGFYGFALGWVGSKLVKTGKIRNN